MSGVLLIFPRLLGTSSIRPWTPPGKPVGMNASTASVWTMAAGSATYQYTEMWDSHERQQQLPATTAYPSEISQQSSPGTLISGTTALSTRPNSADRVTGRAATDHSDYSGTGFIDHFGSEATVTFEST